MKGVMRVGDLAKGLLLSGNLNIELVVLCTEKPSKSLLTKVHQILPGKLKVCLITCIRFTCNSWLKGERLLFWCQLWQVNQNRII